MIVRSLQEVFFGLARWLASGQERAVLMYHAISADTTSPWNVSPQHFRAQMAYLADACDVVSLDQILSSKPTRPTIAITFDDGYADHYSVAAPILAHYGFPAAFFIATGLVGRTNKLSWEQVRALAGQGLTIGAHSVSHRNLAQLEHGDAWEEIRCSREALEQQVGSEVRWFAYPFGGRRALSAEVVEMVREAGFGGAVTSGAGLVHEGMDRFLLPRVGVFAWTSLNQFKGRMSRGIELYASFRDPLKRLWTRAAAHNTPAN